MVGSTNQPELAEAMNDAHGLCVTYWTKLDEGRAHLSDALRQLERGESAGALTNIQWAMKLMNRWQDRGKEYFPKEQRGLHSTVVWQRID